MDARSTLTRIAAPTGDIAAAFYFVPETVAAGKELGLDGFKFYILGRGGALGDVPAAVVSAAFGYFEPGLIENQWAKARAICEPGVAAQAYFDECGRRGAERFGDLEGLDAYCEAADVVIGQASLAARPLFAGIAQLDCSDDVAARAAQKSAVLRELRGSAHLVAVAASGLTDAQAHAMRRPKDVEMFGWPSPPELPDDGPARLDAAEELTNDLLEPDFAGLDDAQAAALVAGTEAMHAAL